MSQRTAFEQHIVVCQLGAREHYAIPRTLHRAGLLNQLVTDIWVSPRSALRYTPGQLGKRLRGRYEEELKDAKVAHFTTEAMVRNARKAFKVKTANNWERMLSENEWFQDCAVGYLKKNRSIELEDQKVVLAYSYSALGIFQYAKTLSAKTILLQIDGGVVDECIIRKKWSDRGDSMPNAAPREYWKNWREECRLADHVLVNSEWSKRLIVQSGIVDEKVSIAPVIYENPTPQQELARNYPDQFDNKRPLKILFLSALSLRKGFLEALDAAKVLVNESVQFTFVGDDVEGWIDKVGLSKNTNIVPRVPRSEVKKLYRDSSVLLFPTHSDGFGLTQVEALEIGLPVIASKNCGAVVTHGKTGLLLEEVSTKAIVEAIMLLLEQPELLAKMSKNALGADNNYMAGSSRQLLAQLETILEAGCN